MSDAIWRFARMCDMQ